MDEVSAAFVVDKEQHVVRNQSAQRQYLHREKVGTRHSHVRANAICPRCRTLPLRRRPDAMAL